MVALVFVVGVALGGAAGYLVGKRHGNALAAAAKAIVADAKKV